MLFIYYFITICYGSISLIWQVYDPSTNLITNDRTITYGQYNKEVRISRSDGLAFQSEFVVYSTLPLNPQFPIGRINNKYLSFRVGLTSTSGSVLTMTLSNSIYTLNSNTITFTASTSQCTITPTSNFMTIPYGGTRNITINFNNCIPISLFSISATYSSVTKTFFVYSQQNITNIEVSSLSAEIDDTITITFVTNNTYYSIKQISLTVINTTQDLPVPSLTMINSNNCVNQTAIFTLGCGKASILYYSYYYQEQTIDINTIQKQLALQTQTNINSYEGYGQYQFSDTSVTNITINYLRSNTYYTMLIYCEDELYQTQSLSTTFYRCDSSQQLKQIILTSYELLHNMNRRDIVCDIMLSLQLKSNQVSTNDGLFCNSIAQAKYNGSKYYQQPTVTDSLYNYTFFIYPDYGTTSQLSSLSISISSYTINSSSMSSFIQSIPSINQEFFSANEQYLNLTISIKSNGFILIGFDIQQSSLPNYQQFHQGLNSLNVPFVNFQKQYCLANVQYQFQFKTSNKNTYQLLYLLQSDPSDGALYSTLQERHITLLQLQSGSKQLIIIFILFIIIL